MEMKEFKYAGKEKKMEVIYSSGVFIAKRRSEAYTIFLYQVNSFYVEIYFYDDFPVAGYMKSFTDLNLLEPYLNHIDISFLNSFL